LKKIILILLANIIIYHLNAAVYTVCNQQGVSRDFSSIQSAIEHASPYDTILVKGSPINYGNILIEKPLVLIGEGFSDEFHTGHTAKITRILLTSNPFRRTISSGTVIKGFEFPYFPGQRPNIIALGTERVKIEDITIERNWLWFIEIVGAAEKWTLRNNIIRGWVNGGGNPDKPNTGAINFTFQNNILNSILSFQRGNVTLENNIITGRLKDVKGAHAINNIFTREDIILENVTSSRFQNNLAASSMIGREECYEQPGRFESRFLCDGEPNHGNSNKVGTDPGFIYWPSDDIMGGAVFKLTENSPGQKSGTGGTQAGIFGGSYPFPATSFLNPEIDNPFPTFVTSIF